MRTTILLTLALLASTTQTTAPTATSYAAQTADHQDKPERGAYVDVADLSDDDVADIKDDLAIGAALFGTIDTDVSYVH